MPLKNITQAPTSYAARGDPRIPDVPSIRLISAKPSASGLAQASPSNRVFDESIMSSTSNPTPWDTLSPPAPPVPLKKRPSRLLPKTSSIALNDASSSSATRLVPKKSKRRLLGSLGNALPNKENARGKDFSDVIRRVAPGNASQASFGSAQLRGGFDIYVDPSADPDIGDILVVKKQKSRAALNSMGWGPATTASTTGSTRGVLGEVTNSVVSEEPRKEKEGGGPLSKVKADEERKWWSIGRGRKESKDERKEKEKENAEATIPPQRSQSKCLIPRRASFLTRLPAPDPFKGTSSQNEQSRGRFNSLDAGILLGLGKKKSSNVLSTEVTPTAAAEPPSAPSPPPTMRRKSYGNILENPQLQPQTQRRKMERVATPPQMTYSRSATPTFGGLFSGPTQNDAPPATNASNQGSIALRAMRSVRSFARLGSWAQGKGEEVSKTEKERTVKDKKEKKGKESVDERKSQRGTVRKEKDDTVRRTSGSSFEAGTLSSSTAQESDAPLSKKRSILGLGLPSSMRLPRLRSGSTASSIFHPPSPAPPVPPIPDQFATFSSVRLTSSNGTAHDDTGTITNGRRSMDSALAQDGVRRTSVQSTSSSLRPVSITSTHSGTSTGSRTSSGRCSSGTSVRWDEEGLQRAKAEREKDFLSKRASIKAGKRATTKDSRSATEPRRRTALSDIFPELAAAAPKAPSPEPEVKKYPILTIEEATADGHGEDLHAPILEESEGEEERRAGESTEESVEVVATPVKKARARPLSEQFGGKARPAAFHEGEEGETARAVHRYTPELTESIGVLTILSAATNDLAQLINHLDLEATPCTPDLTPLKRSSTYSGKPSSSPSVEYNGSPLKKKADSARPGVKGANVLPSQPSVASLRPYGPSKTANFGHPTIREKKSLSDVMFGKAIPSWPLPENASLASLRAKLKPVASSKSKPAVEKKTSSSATVNKTHKRTTTPARVPDPAPALEGLPLPPSKRSVKAVKAKVTPERVKDTFDDSSEDEERYRTLRAMKAGKRPAEQRSGSTTTTVKGSIASKASSDSKMSSMSSRRTTLVEERGVPMTREAKRMLGRSGTMGGSVASAYQTELDYNDPDYDVPEELKHILRKDNANAISYHDVDRRVSHADDDYRDYSAFTNGLHHHDDGDLTMDRASSYSASSFDPSALLRTSSSFASMQRSVAGAEIHRAERLPVFRAQLIGDGPAQDAELDDDSLTCSDDDTTKKSFDFTGELAKLVEDGELDRKSFVEEVEKAFKTTATFDLGPRFGMTLDVPPVPAIPDFVLKTFNSSSTLSSQHEASSQSFESQESVGDGGDVDSAGSPQAPTFFNKSQSFTTGGGSTGSSSHHFWNSESTLDVHQRLDMPSISASSASTRKSRASTSSSASRSFDRHVGELNLSFKFGGLSSASPAPPKVFTAPPNDSLSDELSADESHESHCRPLTLSDVIPPPSRVRQLSLSSSMHGGDGHSVLETRILEASEESNDHSQLRERTISGTSMASTNSTCFIPLTRPSSGVSFAGLDSYEQVRRGFEFNDQRPNWYPGPGAQAATARGPVHRYVRNSVFSIASVSSYGRVIRDGAVDPFDYGTAPRRRPTSAHFAQPPPPMPSLQEWSHDDTSRYSVYSDMSFDSSSQLEDTFSFLHRRPLPRRRVDSDANSFYLNVGAPATRNNRRFSGITGFGVPPVSIYNKSFGHHRRSSSVTSASSIALSYAHGGIGGRAILARHRREASTDSTRQFARPGLGDKMFETAAPLPAIASPSDSIWGDSMSRDYRNNRFSTASFDYCDSVIDADNAYRFDPRRDSIAEADYEDDEHPSSRADSLFEKSQDRSSASSSSLFGNDDSRYTYDQSLPHQFRPISSMSITEVHSPVKEDDTMFSVSNPLLFGLPFSDAFSDGRWWRSRPKTLCGVNDCCVAMYSY